MIAELKRFVYQETGFVYCYEPIAVSLRNWFLRETCTEDTLKIGFFRKPFCHVNISFKASDYC